MIEVHQAITRLRRDLVLSMAAKMLLGLAAVGCLVVEGMGYRGPLLNGPFLLAAVGVVWMGLSMKSLRGTRFAAPLASLIASRQFDRAEENIDQLLRGFSIFGGVKIRGIHHLAMLRHAQKRFAESALLCRELLSQRGGTAARMARSANLVLADSLLEVGDLHGAHQAISALYRHRLPLAEAVELNLIQLDYLSRLGAWGAMLDAAGHKIEMLELMPAERAALGQALLALAAMKSGRPELAGWLARRAGLLLDEAELIARRPALAELWPDRAGGRLNAVG